MPSCVVHVGTEKTGTTSIQSFLATHREAMRRQGFLFPKTCGQHISTRAVCRVMSAPHADLLNMAGLSLADHESRCWIPEFDAQHAEEVEDFQRQYPGGTVVYSSEHFHSRTTSAAEIGALANWLSRHYDVVRVVVYFRRHDHLALSSYNTAVRTGFKQPYNSTYLNNRPEYFDFRRLLENWLLVTAQSNIHCRHFDEVAGKGNLVSDFCRQIGLPVDKFNTDTPPANRSLSASELELLRRFNALDMASVGLADAHRAACRHYLFQTLPDCGLPTWTFNASDGMRDHVNALVARDSEYLVDAGFWNSGFDRLDNTAPSQGNFLFDDVLIDDTLERLLNGFRLQIAA